MSATTSEMRDSKAADLAEGAQDLFCISPLIHSQPLSALVGKPVYLKLDALQASGSFKVCTIPSMVFNKPMVSPIKGNLK